MFQPKKLKKMLDFRKQTAPTAVPVFVGKVENATGGFTLTDPQFLAGETLPAGTLIGYDEATRLAKVVKIAVLQAEATNNTTTYKVLKNHLLKVGMKVKFGTATEQTITQIDTTNQGYDTLTLSATLGVKVEKGNALFVDDKAYTSPKGLLYESVTIGANGLAGVSVTLKATAYARRIQPISDELKAQMPNIIFSQSF